MRYYRVYIIAQHDGRWFQRTENIITAISGTVAEVGLFEELLRVGYTDLGERQPVTESVPYHC